MVATAQQTQKNQVNGLAPAPTVADGQQYGQVTFRLEAKSINLLNRVVRMLGTTPDVVLDAAIADSARFLGVK